MSVLDAGSYQISLFCSFKELDFAIMQNPQVINIHLPKSLDAEGSQNNVAITVKKLFVRQRPRRQNKREKDAVL